MALGNNPYLEQKSRISGSWGGGWRERDVGLVVVGHGSPPSRHRLNGTDKANGSRRPGALGRLIGDRAHVVIKYSALNTLSAATPTTFPHRISTQRLPNKFVNMDWYFSRFAELAEDSD